MATQTGALTVNGLLTAQASTGPQILVAGTASSLELHGGTGTGSFIFPSANSSGGHNLTVRGGNCTTGNAGDLLILAGINGSAAYGDVAITGDNIFATASTAFEVSAAGMDVTLSGTFLVDSGSVSFDSNSYVFLTGNARFDGSVWVGGSTLDASAVLQANSISKGFLPPRMTTTQRDLISSPAAGLVIFNTTTETLQFYDGFSWVDAHGSGSSSSSSQMSFTETFVNGDLSSSILTVLHNLNQTPVVVQVFNNLKQYVIPDLITLTNNNTASIDLSSFTPITGTWSIIILS